MKETKEIDKTTKSTCPGLKQNIQIQSIKYYVYVRNNNRQHYLITSS